MSRLYHLHAKIGLGALRWERLFHLVVEPFPIRDLAADCPIHEIFKHSHLNLFHFYVVVSMILRGFQQFKGFNHTVSKCGGLPFRPSRCRLNNLIGFLTLLAVNKSFHHTPIAKSNYTSKHNAMGIVVCHQ